MAAQLSVELFENTATKQKRIIVAWHDDVIKCTKKDKVLLRVSLNDLSQHEQNVLELLYESSKRSDEFDVSGLIAKILKIGGRISEV
ncbi:hypothetical protein ACFLZY_03015 [Patescibacteria group bacterium]